MRRMYYVEKSLELFLDEQQDSIPIFVDTFGNFDGTIHLLKMKIKRKYLPILGFYDYNLANENKTKLQKLFDMINIENSSFIKKIKYDKNVKLNNLGILLSTDQLKLINEKDFKEYKKKLKVTISKIYDELIDYELKTNNIFKDFENYNIDYKYIIYNNLMKRKEANYFFISSVKITDIFA